jgi:hypothetical protein
MKHADLSASHVKYTVVCFGPPVFERTAESDVCRNLWSLTVKIDYTQTE